MDKFQQIISTVSIEQQLSSVNEVSKNSIQNNDTVILHSFINHNQIKKVYNQPNNLKVNTFLNRTDEYQFRNKCLKTEINQPQTFNQLKIFTKYSAVDETDSEDQLSSCSEEIDQVQQKPQVLETTKTAKVGKRQKMKPFFERQKVKKNQKNNSLRIKEDSKHLSLTAASQSINIFKAVNKENMKSILFRQISKNKGLQDELARVKLQNNQLRSIISQFSNKKLDHRQVRQDFEFESKMKPTGRKGHRQMGYSNNKDKNKKNDESRRINTEGNLLMKRQNKRILKMQKKIDKFEQILNNLKTRLKKNTQDAKQSRLIKKTRLKTENRQKKQNSSKFQ